MWRAPQGLFTLLLLLAVAGAAAASPALECSRGASYRIRERVTEEDCYGFAVHRLGGLTLVGSPRLGVSPVAPGRAFVFSSPSSFVELRVEGASPLDLLTFGHSVRLMELRGRVFAAVGAPFAGGRPPNAYPPGALFLFGRANASHWAPLQVTRGPGGAAQLGHSMVSHRERLFVSAVQAGAGQGGEVWEFWLREGRLDHVATIRWSTAAALLHLSSDTGLQWYGFRLALSHALFDDPAAPQLLLIAARNYNATGIAVGYTVNILDERMHMPLAYPPGVGKRQLFASAMAVSPDGNLAALAAVNGGHVYIYDRVAESYEWALRPQPLLVEADALRFENATFLWAAQSNKHVTQFHIGPKDASLVSTFRLEDYGASQPYAIALSDGLVGHALSSEVFDLRCGLAPGAVGAPPAPSPGSSPLGGQLLPALLVSALLLVLLVVLGFVAFRKYRASHARSELVVVHGEDGEFDLE